MVIMILFIVLSFVAGKLCEDREEEGLKLSNDYLDCLNSLNGDSCERARNEFEDFYRLCKLGSEESTVTQRVVDFTAGFYNGVQKNATVPANCVTSLVSTRNSWEKLFNEVVQAKFVAPIMLIFNFNELVQKAFTAYGLCGFSTVYNVFHPSSIPLGLNTILTRWLIKKDDVRLQIRYFSGNLTLNDYISAGVSAGVLFTYLTGYQIN